jgi:F-type H+-transporting ATPase subunit alpha
MKKVAGKLRLDLAQYRELATFAQFGAAELDKATRSQLERGQRMTEVLKQPQYVPMPLEKEVTILYAVINGYLDDVPPDKVVEFEEGFHRFMEMTHPDLSKRIAEQKELSDDTEEALKGAVTEYKKSVPILSAVAKEETAEACKTDEGADG